MGPINMIIRFLGAVFLLILNAEVARAQANQAVQHSMRLGMIAPLSGDFAPFGEHVRLGIELAQLKLREKGITAEIFYEDACLAVQARTAIKKLITVNRIDGLVGSYCVVGIVPSAPIIEQAKLVSFHTSPVPQELLNSGNHIFTTNSRIADEGYKLAEYAFGRLKARRAAVLYLTSQWGEEYNTHFTKRFAELGGVVTGAEYSGVDVTDFRAELLRLKAGDPDVILFVQWGGRLGTALKQARNLGLRGEYLTVNEAEESVVVSVAKDNAEGIQYFAPEPAIETTEMKHFNSEFVTYFKRPANPLSRHSYDATILTATVLAECNLDRACAQKKLYQTKGYSGASGLFSIDADGGVQREFTLKTVKNGEFVKKLD